MASAQKAIENNRKRASEWQKKNREKRKIIEARWLKNNADKRKAYQALWLKANLGKHRAHQARRRGVKRQQTCSCCEKLKFNEFYSATPEGYEVDHKVPLSRGGMHCLKNLQYLTPADNRSKGARYAA